MVKLDIALFFQTLQVLSLELFPTKFRAQGYSYCFLFGRMSASTMPFVLTLFRSNLGVHPVFAIGLVLGLGILLSLQVRDVNEFTCVANSEETPKSTQTAATAQFGLTAFKA